MGAVGLETVDRPPLIQPSHPPEEPDPGWYRLAFLLTRNAPTATEVLKAILSIAREELSQLRNKERRKIWMIRQIRSRCLKSPQVQPALEAPDTLASRVAALPEPDRTAFALFHCVDARPEDLAQALGLHSAAFAQALAHAREALAPGTIFPPNALLQVHRPWGKDQPKVAKAVRSAAASPALAAQVTADTEWHSAMAQIALPEELALWNPGEPPRPCLRALVFQPAVLAIVLALLVVVGVTVYFAKNRMGDFNGKETVMAFVEAAGAAEDSAFEPIPPTAAEKLDDWFVLKGFEGYAVPPQLANAKALGCRISRYKGIQVAEVALARDHALLLVFRAADIQPPMDKGEHIFQQDGWAVATQGDDENGYVIMFQGDSDEMPVFLKSMDK